MDQAKLNPMPAEEDCIGKVRGKCGGKPICDDKP